MVKKNVNIAKYVNLVVKFYEASDDEINDYLYSLNLTGVRVSNIINMWAIEVPFWKESYYINELMQSPDLVEAIYLNKKNQFVESEIYE